MQGGLFFGWLKKGRRQVERTMAQKYNQYFKKSAKMR